MSRDVQRDVQRCPEMSRVVHRCPESQPIFSAVKWFTVAYKVVSDVDLHGQFESEVGLSLGDRIREI